MIVNQEAISNEKLTMMFRANERENEISVGTSYDLERLFEDVILRFQRSRHLDASQKDAYAQTLSALSRSLRDAETSEGQGRRETYRALVRRIAEAIEAGHTKGALKLLSDLDGQLQQAQQQESVLVSMWAGYVNLLRKRRKLFVAVLVVYVIVIVVALIIGTAS